MKVSRMVKVVFARDELQFFWDEERQKNENKNLESFLHHHII